MEVKNCYKCRHAFKPEEKMWSGLHDSCFCDWFGVDAPDSFHDIAAHSSDESKEEFRWKTSSFFHGKFRKYSGLLKQNQRKYLLKVLQPEVPELPAMEYLCNQLARALGLKVPDHFFIRFENELDTFLSENFMQDYPSSNLVHIFRFLDAPDQFSCEGLLRIIEREVKRFDDIDRFVKLCLFDSLIGNHDRHGRNLGLIQTSTQSHLAPFYDNPSYLALEDPLLLGAFHEPRGSIITKESQEPTMRDYVREWLRLGFADSVKEFKNRVNLDLIHALIAKSYVSPKRGQALTRLILRRYKELCDEL